MTANHPFKTHSQPDLLMTLGAVTGLSIVSLPELMPRPNRVAWVSGAPGSGKTVHAIDSALNGVRAGRHVVVIGVGHPFRTFARLTGGSLTRLLPDGTFSHEMIATCSAEVFDLGGCAYASGHCKAPHATLPLVHAAGRQTLLVVDEFERSTTLIPGLTHFLADAIGAGASSVVTSQFEFGADAASEFRRLVRRMQVPCTGISLTRQP